MMTGKPMASRFRNPIQQRAARFSPRRGTSIVEFALIVPVVLALLIGILESGWMSKNYLSVANAAREGARSAALGKSTTAVKTRVQNAARPINVPAANIVLAYSPNNGTNYYAVGDTGTGDTAQNDAPAGSMVRVNVSITHQSLTRFFPYLNNRTIAVAVVMRREAT